MEKRASLPYSRLRSTNRQVLSEIVPLPGPLSVWVEPTNLCNFRCRQCPVSFSDFSEIVGGAQHMDFNLYSKVIADLKALGGVKALHLYGDGEPLLHRDIAKMVRLARAEDVAERIDITSNGSLLRDDISRELIHSGLDYLRISVYGVTDQRQAYVTQVRWKPQQIRDNLRRFLQIRAEMKMATPTLYVKMIETLTDEDRAFQELYQELADEVALEPAMDWDGFEGRDLLGPLYPGQTIDRNRGSRHRKEVCPLPWYTLYISSNGDVVACCVDWNRNTLVGNVGQESIGEIWRGERMSALRRLHAQRRRADNESCRNCTYLHTLPALDDLDATSPERLLRT